MTDAVGVIADLWRFPVKSMGGERLRASFIGPFGPIGDRRYAVVARDELVSARRQAGLLGYRSTYADADAVEEVRVTSPDGRVMSLDDPDLEAELSDLMEADIQIHRGQSFPDIAPVHIVSVHSISALGTLVGDELDVRRFRPNIVVESAAGEPFVEAEWVGRTLAIGPTARLEVVIDAERCAVTTIDPDTLNRDKAVLATIARERENLFGVYARVVRAGWVGVGDDVRLLTP